MYQCYWVSNQVKRNALYEINFETWIDNHFHERILSSTMCGICNRCQINIDNLNEYSMKNEYVSVA